MMNPDVSVIEVIKVVYTQGKGIEEDPCRRVTGYWTKDGDLIAIVDDWEDE